VASQFLYAGVNGTLPSRTTEPEFDAAWSIRRSRTGTRNRVANPTTLLVCATMRSCAFRWRSVGYSPLLAQSCPTLESNAVIPVKSIRFRSCVWP